MAAEHSQLPERGQAPDHIYTKFGDAGQTRLLSQAVVWKDDPRVEVYGCIDEATSALGLARSTTRYDDLVELSLAIQGELSQVMSLLATPPGAVPPVLSVTASQVSKLEAKINVYEAELLVTGFFVRPGGSQASAALHLARTIVRRAERRLVSVSRVQAIDPLLLQYLNRLSDLLYILARIDEQREIRRMVMATISSSAGAEGRSGSVLDLALCDAMVEAGIRRAREVGVPMVLAVVDASGNLLELRRMDNALTVSLSLAPRKAYTAAAVRMPTSQLGELAQPGAALYGIDVNTPNLTLVGGGLPVVKDGAVIGAVGVSGGSVEQDVSVAQAMLAPTAKGG